MHLFCIIKDKMSENPVASTFLNTTFQNDFGLNYNGETDD